MPQAAPQTMKMRCAPAGAKRLGLRQSSGAFPAARSQKRQGTGAVQDASRTFTQPSFLAQRHVDTIIINELEVFYRVGVPEAERAQPQRLLLTIEMGSDFAAAALTDELAQTIDYEAVAQRLRHFGEGRSWRLLERLAVAVAEMLRAEFGAQRVAVEVRKFILPEARYVGVRVERPELRNRTSKIER